jgi:predicted ATPase/DNA-binding SARP family transcriptional activator
LIADQELPARIKLLGPFEVQRGARALLAEDWPRKKAAALLKRLAFERRMLKDQAIEFLWPEASFVSAANNLYKTLHALRRNVDQFLGEGAAEAILRFEDGVLSLAPEVWVDVQEFERLCAASAASSAEQRRADLEEALSLYQDDLLPDDRYEEWTQLPRQELYSQQRVARLSLAAYRRDILEYSSAIALLKPLLSHDPADEPVHRELMRLYAMAGQRHEALRQYQACEQALAAEIDVPPTPETKALYAQILNNELLPSPALAQGLIPSPAFPPVEQPPPLFVGRERELSVLYSHLNVAIAGEGRILFITGEAGQGKTSLMAEFAHRSLAKFPELVIAAGTCQALIGIADPYLPFRDLMAMLTGDWQRPWLGGEISTVQAQRLLAIAPQTAQAIANYAPDLVDIIVPVSTLAERRSPSSLGLNQRQIFDQTRQLLSALALHQPLLLLLDDLQWADTASANLLFYLGRQLVHSSVLIIGAYRPSEVDPTNDPVHPLATVVQELVRYRGEIQIDLDTSVPVEERSFIDALLDSEPNQLDASFREAMYRRTKGNPLFTVELLRALQDQGDLMKDEGGMWSAAANLDWGILPARVEAVIARRIGTLSQELRQILDIASVEGESFTVEVIAEVFGTEVRRLLQQLSREVDQRHRLVREQGEWRLGTHSTTHYQFRHNLFQQYLYSQLGDAERRALHGEIAAALERIAGDDLDRLAVSLAHHYLAAGDAVSAVPHLCSAGDDARRRVALEEAVQFYESALNYWQENDPASKAQVLQKVGETFLALGNSSKAIERFFEADRLHAQAGNRTGMGAMQRLIGRSYFEQGDRAKALDHYHRVLSLLEHDPENAELARVISAISQMHMTASQYDEAIAWGERALSLARATEIGDVILHALTTVGTSLANKGEAERGLPMLAESQERAVALSLPHDAGRAYAGWGDALVTLERYEEARAIYNRMLAYAQKVHTGMFEGVAMVQLGYLDWWGGDWRQAWTRRQEIIDWMATIQGASFAKVWASNFLGLMYNDLGMPEKARAVLTEYTAVARSSHEPQTTVPHLGQLARCTQSEAQTAGLVQEILSLTDTANYPPYELIPALTFACGWLAQNSGGDTTTLVRLEKLHMQKQNQQSAASLYEVRAFAAGIRGEWGQAVLHYKEAAANWEALQRPYDLLRTLAGISRALINTADTASAKDVQQQATSIIEQLAYELDDPEVKEAFLASPLIEDMRRH